MKRFNGLSHVVCISGSQGVSEIINTLKMKRSTSMENLAREVSPFVWRSMNLFRAIICMAFVAFAGVALLAQTVPGVVTINGGRNVLAVNALPSAMQADVEPAPPPPFYSNFASGKAPYNCDEGYTVSELGSPVGAEYTPAAQFTSARTGVTTTVTVAVGWVAGANGARVTLDLDCAGVPCGVDTKYLCRANITHLPTFGTSCTRTETLKCRAKLARGRKYWVYVEAPMPPNNTEDGWNLSNAASGTIAESVNDAPWVAGASQPLPAFSVQ
jgi:hypothetical protein